MISHAFRAQSDALALAAIRESWGSRSSVRDLDVARLPVFALKGTRSYLYELNQDLAFSSLALCACSLFLKHGCAPSALPTVSSKRAKVH